MEQRGRRSVQRRGLDMQSAGTRAREVNYSLHKLLGVHIPLSKLTSCWALGSHKCYLRNRLLFFSQLLGTRADSFTHPLTT
ncbi:hypothetical protein XELAEV_18003954mg [Xenopus laevis]|uniref:Uncharacterized protein n=1 Tax=Xenopus laevis TaxID=8355 RepID=A0A974H007_XENLA|nr:hypothetical protein XELAEV_18003954mg [Xenopus laevis]